MTNYKATTRITIPLGMVVRLNAEQAADRTGVLTINDDGTHTTLTKIELKAGEEFGLDGDLGKATMDKLELVGGDSTPASEEESVPKAASSKPKAASSK